MILRLFEIRIWSMYVFDAFGEEVSYVYRGPVPKSMSMQVRSFCKMNFVKRGEKSFRLVEKLVRAIGKIGVELKSPKMMKSFPEE